MNAHTKEFFQSWKCPKFKVFQDKFLHNIHLELFLTTERA